MVERAETADQSLRQEKSLVRLQQKTMCMPRRIGNECEEKETNDDDLRPIPKYQSDKAFEIR